MSMSAMVMSTHRPLKARATTLQRWRVGPGCLVTVYSTEYIPRVSAASTSRASCTGSPSSARPRRRNPRSMLFTRFVPNAYTLPKLSVGGWGVGGWGGWGGVFVSCWRGCVAGNVPYSYPLTPAPAHAHVSPHFQCLMWQSAVWQTATPPKLCKLGARVCDGESY